MASQVSRPMQIALIAVVLFGLAWMVALRPGGDTSVSTSSPSSAASPAAAHSPPSGPQAPGVTGLGNAVEKAKGAVAASDAASAAHGGEIAAAQGSAAAGRSERTARSERARTAGAPARVTRERGPAGRAARALARRQVLAILFFNPRGADDRATRANLRRLRAGRAVVRIAAPLSELSSFGAVTRRVAVTASPTLVVFDRSGTPSTLVGYADGAEIGQRVADALARR